MDVGDSRLTDRILAAFFASFHGIGFGLPESVCANALAVELQARDIAFRREVPLTVVYRGVEIGFFRADSIVEDQVVLEIKSAESIRATDEAQLLNYLRVSKYEVGLLLVFGVKPRFRRLVYSNGRKRP